MGAMPASLICPGMPGIIGQDSRFSLDAFMAAQSDGFWYDFTKTDRLFQESNGPTPADDAGEVIGLALDQRQWRGVTLAQILAAATEQATNGDFSSATGWTLGGSSTISAGALNVSNAQTPASRDPVDTLLQGKLYRVELKIDALNLGTASGISVRLGSGAGSSNTGAVYTTTGVKVEYLYAASAITNNKIDLVGRGGSPTITSATIDYISVKLVPGIPAIQASGTLKPTFQTTGAKFDGSDDNQLTGYLAANGANFIAALVDVPSSIAATSIVAGAAGAGVNRSFIAFDTSGHVCGGVGSDSVGVIVGTSNLANSLAVIGLTYDGATVRIFANASQEYSGAQNSTPTTSVPYRLGGLNNNGTASAFYGGSIKKIVSGREYLTLSRYNQIRNALLAA